MISELRYSCFFQPIEEAECSILKKACKGMGTEEKLVVLVLAGR